MITEEFGEWEDSNRRIDLLAIDRKAKLVVIELKRTQDGGHMELQAIRYAAMVSTLTFDQVVAIHERYLRKKGRESADARENILNFLEWNEPDEEAFANDVRIILVSAEFSKEITTSVMWLNSRDLDIRCIRIKPYKLDQRILLDVQQIIPLPEAEEYQIKVKEKDKKQRSKTRWEERPIEEIWQEIQESYSPEEFHRAETIRDWLATQVTGLFGTRNAFAPSLNLPPYNQFFFKVTVDGKVEIWFQHLANKLPFSEESLRRQLLEKLNRIPQVNISESKLKGRPCIPIKLLLDEQAFQLFKDAFDWVFSTVKAEKAKT